MSKTITLAKELMAKTSITPDDQGCQDLLRSRLEKLGFACETLQFGEVTNLWARLGEQTPLFVFAGHTDVVPPGPLDQWTTPPFEPNVRGEQLYGRGAVDMKGAIAAMLTAIERFLQAKPTLHGSIALLITSDEEDGASREGTPSVIDALSEQGVQIDYCLVGEPTSEQSVGDMIKNGRRGSLSGHLIFHGVQGHIAYPELSKNPIPLALQACHALTQEPWDNGNEFFQPTQCQISNIHAGEGVTNVIPGSVQVDFNLRYSSELTADKIQARVHSILNQFDIEHTINWHLSGEPYFTQPGTLLTVVSDAIQTVTGNKPKISTHGGTSDGRFIAPTGAQVVECGVDNRSAHQINESVRVDDLDKLSEIYEKVLEKILT